MSKTVGGSWLRMTVPTADQIKEIIAGVIGRKSDALKNHKDLRYNIGVIYRDVVKPYIPYSGLNKAHHLNEGYVTNDGRIIWTATSTYAKKSSDEDEDERSENNTKSFNYAMIQYTNPLYNHPTRYEGHEPQSRWTDAVQPATAPWQERFIPAITPLIVEEFEDA